MIAATDTTNDEPEATEDDEEIATVHRPMMGVMFNDVSNRLILTDQKTQTRRPVKGLAVHLPSTVRSDVAAPGLQALIARAGVWPARLNDHGAVTLEHSGGGLGVKPGEFHFDCPLVDGETFLAQHGEGKKVWTILPRGGTQRVYVKEAWRTAERSSDGVDGVVFRADETFVPIQNTRAAADRWIDAHANGVHGTKWRNPRFMPRWAARTYLDISLVRLMRLQDLSEGDAMAEGATFTDYGLNPYGKARAGWSVGPSENTNQCLDTARLAVGNAWNRIHAGENWNLRYGPSPWDQNPWVWAYTFRRVVS